MMNYIYHTHISEKHQNVEITEMCKPIVHVRTMTQLTATYFQGVFRVHVDVATHNTSK